MLLTDRTRLERAVLAACAGLLGATGVGAAAMASHAGDGPAHSLAQIALTHAPVLLMLSERPSQGRLELAARLVLLIGVIGFCLDMGLRTAAGSGLGPLAPAFGGGIIIGWLVLGLARVIVATLPAAK